MLLVVIEVLAFATALFEAGLALAFPAFALGVIAAVVVLVAVLANLLAPGLRGEPRAGCERDQRRGGGNDVPA
jgi:hypothetical protein